MTVAQYTVFGLLFVIQASVVALLVTIVIVSYRSF